MTTLALFVTGWAAWGCLVNIPAWIRLVIMPAPPRAEWVRLGMVLQALGTGIVLVALASAIWANRTLAPLVLFGLILPAESVIVWAGLIGLAETAFVWTSQLPKDPPVLGISWPWLIYLAGTFSWAVAVLLWAAGALS